MDLFNNQVGRDKYDVLSYGFTSLEESILNSLNNRELRYLKNLAGNGQATSASALTPTNL